MITTSVADRRFRISLWCLIVAIFCAVVNPLACYLVFALAPQETGWKGLEDLARAILWAMGGLIVAGCIALASLGYGMACARERKRVLFWVVPLWIAAASGLVAGLVQLTLLVDEKVEFIPGGKRDDLSFLLVAWFGFVSLHFLAYWVTSVVYGIRFRLLPWWSGPLWAVALTGGILLLG